MEKLKQYLILVALILFDLLMFYASNYFALDLGLRMSARLIAMLFIFVIIKYAVFTFLLEDKE